jgi:peptidylprolyl isomerase
MAGRIFLRHPEVPRIGKAAMAKSFSRKRVDRRSIARMLQVRRRVMPRGNRPGDCPQVNTPNQKDIPIMMDQAKPGNRVKVEFVGTLPDGTVFGQATAAKPLEFTLGKGEIISGFEEAVVGMKPGQAVTTDIPAEKAFGPKDGAKTVAIGRDRFPTDFEPEVGKRIGVRRPGGDTVPATVQEITDDSVQVDLNHPLAGQNLHFDIRLLEVC